MRSIHNFKVIYEDVEYDLSENDMIVNYLRISSPSPVHTRDTVPGAHGYIDMGTQYEGRQMEGKITIKAKDYLEYPIKRNKVFQIFFSRKPFYLIRDQEPGRKWLVKVDSAFNIPQIALTGEFTFTLSSPSAFSQSLGSTLEAYIFNYDYGQGLSVDDYIHSTSSFSIYNAGDELINPRQMKLVIKFQGASTNLKIKNLTTNEEWTYTGSSNVGDVIELNGILASKNELSIVPDTNFKAITLEPGWNEFLLTGTSDPFEISFDFHYQFL
ncbi:phage tail family protein [Sutcliffiella horikoshii]|uniref:Phage tail family protein n=1 Tax=Sutcliffiella horikoshii TaxID=79883 RepID=A0A5D4T3D2_9BACI|nr:phage tail family protein [Sutcliffiella horikoshii]TYS68654.1 phage tail family protein [Sutcliffiella horikoshii]